jgi:hypothetical protein
MKASLLALVLLLTLPTLADGPLTIVTRKSQRLAYGGRCQLNSTFPEVVGRPDLSKAIKTLLPQPVPKSELYEDWDVKIEQNFEVTFNDQGLLSVFGAGLRTDVKDGRMMSAHPTKLFNGIVLDTQTGRSYSLRDLFGQDVYSKLDGLLAQRVAQLAESDEVQPLTSHTYRCYLSKDGVTFYQIVDNFALGGIEVTLPYPEAAKLAPATSPLRRFAQKS